MNELAGEPTSDQNDDANADLKIQASVPAEGRDDLDDIIYPSVIPFVLVHLACFAAIWTGVTWQSVVLCAALYWLRIFAIGAGYHRYFSHRAFTTSRTFQLVLALVAQSPTQKSVLWWPPSTGTIICIPTPARSAFAAPGLLVQPHGLDLRAGRIRSTSPDRGFRQVPRADVAQPLELAPQSCWRSLLAGGRMARPGGGILGTVLVYRRSASIAGARARAQAM